MTIKTLSMIAAVLSVGVLEAQDEATSEAEAAAPAPAPAKTFTALPFCRAVVGVAEVLPPMAEDWSLAEEGKFYPLGTQYRTRESGSLTLSFGPDSTATIEGEASFATKAQPLGEASRTVVLGTGTLSLNLARNLPEGVFFVAAPGFVIKNLAGESKVTYAATGDGDEAVVRCVTGTLAVGGRHFDIPQMRAANEVRIRSSQDYLFTALYGTSGNYSVRLDCGMSSQSVLQDDGSMKDSDVKSEIVWALTPETRVEILRAKPAIGERLSVCVTTWDAAGEKQNERAFTEGLVAVNSGELVKKAHASADELAKKAAEATEEAAATEEAPAEEPAATTDNNN